MTEEESSSEESDISEYTTEEETDEEESEEETDSETEELQEGKEINFIEGIQWNNKKEGKKMGKLLEEYKDSFYREGNEILGRTNIIEHEIKIEEGKRPIKQRAYSIFDPKKLEYQK